MISDKNLARIAGFCYLIVVGTGLFSEVFVRQALRVPNDALATAHNIQANEMLFRWGFTADIIKFAVGLPTILIIYFLIQTNQQIIITTSSSICNYSNGYNCCKPTESNFTINDLK